MAGNQFDDTLDDVLDQSPAPAAAPQDDPFAAALNSVLDDDRDQRSARMRVAGDRADAITPDRAADVYTLARRYGLPADHVARNFDDIQRRARHDNTPYAQMLRETPALAEYVSDPIQAAAVKADLEPLALLEKTARVTADSFRALASGVPRLNASLWGVIESGAELAGANDLAKLAKEYRLSGMADADFARGPQAGAGELAKAFYSGWESLGIMVPGAIMSAMSGTPAPMLTTMGAATAGEAYGRARDQGVGVARSNLFAFTQGGIEVATEMIPAKLWIKDLTTNAPFWKLVLHQLASEIPGEQVATALQDLDEWATLHPELPFQKYLDERPSAAVQTLVATITSVGAMSAVTSTVSRFAGDNGKVERAGQSKSFFDAIAQAVGSMQSAEKHPASIETVIANATAGGPIEKLYAPVDTFTTYWQSVGEDPAAKAAELTGDPRAYENALRTGEDLAIPTGAYAARIANTDHNAYFVNELRLAPDEMNIREATAFKEQQAAAAQAQADQATAAESPAGAIAVQLRQSLEAAGVERGTAAQYVDLVESTFGNMAEIAIDPQGIFGQLGLTVERPDLAEPAAKPETGTPAAPQTAQAAIPLEPEAQAVQAPAAPGEPAVAVAREPNIIPADVREEGVTDETGRTLGGYAGPERRGVQGAAPGGVERRNEPVGLQPGFGRGDVGAAAARLRAENPNIMRDAEAMRARAAEAGRIAEPPELKAQRHGAVLDKKARGEDTTEDVDAGTKLEASRIVDQGGSPAENRVAASDPGSGKKADQRAATHLEKVFGVILDSARSIDANVDEARLRQEFDFRVDLYLDQHQLAADSDTDPHLILRTIAQYGGISIADTAERSSDVLQMLGGSVPAFGAVAGVAGVFGKPRAAHAGGAMAKQGYRTNAAGVKVPVKKSGAGAKARGHGIDVMLQMLQGDNRFLWLDSIDMLLDQIDEAMRHGAEQIDAGILPGTEELRDVGIRRELNWWQDGWAAADLLDDVDEAAIEGAQGDTSFDVSEFNQSLFDEFDALEDPRDADTLATGEVQPRLPEAGAVREQEIATPAVAEAPFSLTAPIAKPGKKNAGQTTLFQSEGVTAESVRAWAESVRTRAGDDVKAFDVNLTSNGDLSLDSIIVARGAQRAGLGSRLMKELTRFADANGLRVLLTPGQRDPHHGTTSRARLVKFYKRFGFVENKGRRADLRVSAGMLREPNVPTTTEPVAATATPAFKAWFGESKVVDEDGAPLRVFHGTTGSFESFDRERGNIESDFGAGIYFSNNASDVGENYAGIGPDLKSKIERRAEQIQDRYADNDGQAADEPGPTVERVTELLAASGLTLETATAQDRDAAFKAIAAEELGVEHGGLTMPAYLKIEHPAIVGGVGGTYLEMSQAMDEETGDFLDEEPTGTLVGFLTALRDVSGDFQDHDVDTAIRELYELANFEGIDLARAIDALRTSEGLQYTTDDSGNLASTELIRQALAAAGYDGIIDQTVDKKFGSQKRVGKPMAGMDPDTVHYIVFAPTQIKSAIGNRGTFDPSKSSILFQDERNIGGTDRRGAIRFGADRQFTISLLEKADLSTFLHESGHLFLEVFGDLADQLKAVDVTTLTPRQAQAVADYDALLKWLGVENRGAIGTEQHEQFARGFEAYLMEGRAPSQELRIAFARFRAWLVSIYRSLKGLKVNLTDDVRRVMDRMVASEDAIAQAEAEGVVTPMFTTAESAGMTPERFELYRQTIATASNTAREHLEVRMLAELQREQEQAWKTQRQEINDVVRVETYDLPVYQAIVAMQRGTKPNGGPLVEGTTSEPLKLSRQAIVDRYGKDRLKRLPRPYVYTTDGGLDPDVAATMFGYTSGDELLNAVEAAEPMARRIERETDRRMIEQHGSMLLDGSLQERAQAAIANEHRDEIVREELRALVALRRKVSPFARQAAKEATAAAEAEIGALAGEVKELKATARGGANVINAALPSANVVREAAKLAVARMTVREIKPAVYWAAARRSSQKARDAAARQDFDTAIAAAQQELMNLAVFREATTVLEDIDKRVQRARDLSRPSAQRRLAQAGESYLDQINTLLDRYDFARQTGKVLDRRDSLRQWVDALKAQDIPIDIPDDVIDDARRIHFTKLSVEELIGVTDALTHINHLAGLKDKLFKNKEQREFEIVRDNVAGSIREHNTENPLPVAFRRPERVRRKIKDIFASHARIATLAQLMDGRDEGGPVWSAFVRPANEAATEKQVRQSAEATAFAKILEQHYPGRQQNRFHDKLHIPAIGDSLTLDERIAVARNWGNETSRDRMLNDPQRAWNQEQIQAILDTLDKNDLAYVQATFDYLERFWPEIAAKQKRVTGLEPEKVAPLEIITKAGTIPGGYFPLVADSRYNARTRQWEKLSEADLKRTGAYVSSTTKRGHVEARVKHARYTVKLEGGVIFSHIEQVVHDLTHHEMLIDLTRLLRDSKIGDAFYDTVGDVVYDQFTSAVEAIAAGRLEGPRNMVDEAAQFMKTRTQVALLGWNLWTGLQQPLGLFNGADRVGATWIAKGMFQWLTSPARMERTVKWIHDASPYMAGRAGNATQELSDLKRVFSARGGWFDTMVRGVTGDVLTQQRLLDSMLWHIGLMQRVADVPTWLGQYEKSKAGGESDDRAVALADQAVIDAQGSGRISDLAKVQRGGPVAQLYMTFYSYGSTTFNATYRRAGRTDFKKPIQVAQFLGGLSLIYIFPAIGTVLLNHLVRGAGDDDDDWQKWFTEVGRESAAAALNGMVLVRELSSAVARETRGYAGPAGARVVVMMNQLLEQAKQGELDDAAIAKALEVGGVLAGLPTAQIQRTIDGWRAIRDKDAPYSSLLFGPPQK